MNYSKEMQKIEDFLQREYYRDAGRSCGSILELVLKDIYAKIKIKSPPSDVMRLLEIEEKKSKGKGGFQTFTLGELVGLFREGRIFNLIEPVLGKKLKLALHIPLNDLVDIRNDCTHSDHVPTLEELHFFHTNLKVFLSELGYIKNDLATQEATQQQAVEINCPECNEPVEQDWEICPYCEARIKLVCPQCDREVEKLWKICPFCKSRPVDEDKAGRRQTERLAAEESARKKQEQPERISGLHGNEMVPKSTVISMKNAVIYNGSLESEFAKKQHWSVYSIAIIASKYLANLQPYRRSGLLVFSYTHRKDPDQQIKLVSDENDGVMLDWSTAPREYIHSLSNALHSRDKLLMVNTGWGSHKKVDYDSADILLVESFIGTNSGDDGKWPVKYTRRDECNDVQRMQTLADLGYVTTALSYGASNDMRFAN